MSPIMDFANFVTRATGGAGPRAYQALVAHAGLPEMLCVPTGSGKTLAAVLPWLWRRRNKSEPTTRLVLVLPQRVLVEQTVKAIRGWLKNLGESVPVHVLMGGAEWDDFAWKTTPSHEQIFVGTQDLILSRLLMRGYAESRAAWPMSFGLLHNGTQFVFDEVQLFGPGLGTSLQLQGFRRKLGTALPSRSMWMSATLGPLKTVDYEPAGKVVRLSEADRDGEFATVLDAKRGFSETTVDAEHYAKSVAELVLTHHQPGTRTLVVLNTVARAKEVFQALGKQHENPVLLHSRFRPPERRALAERITTGRAADQIVVATQVLEAGVDITSRTLITEIAPWTSIVQRAGRCNRYGECDGAGVVLWLTPPGKSSAPYEKFDVDETAKHLRTLEGREFTGEDLSSMTVEQTGPLYQLLRRHHLIELFDTTPDLSGNDIDIGPYIRDADEQTVFLAWRTFDGDEPPPHREELCPAPIADVRAMAKNNVLRVYDQQRSRWMTASQDDVRPTARLAVLAGAGGYSETLGFDVKSKQPVTPVQIPQKEKADQDDGMNADPGTTGNGQWYPLCEHAADAVAALEELIKDVELDEDITEALRLATRHHDLGKHHTNFREALRTANPEHPPPDDEVVYAKSPGNGRPPYNPRYFRHELVSALLLRESGFLDGVAERDLAIYLALAHHGKIRLSVRPHVSEGNDVVRGVREGDRVVVDGVEHTLSLRATRFGAGSLTSAALALRDRDDIGPFRLAYYESLVRAADWLASEKAEKDGGQP